MAANGSSSRTRSASCSSRRANSTRWNWPTDSVSIGRRSKPDEPDRLDGVLGVVDVGLLAPRRSRRSATSGRAARCRTPRSGRSGRSRPAAAGRRCAWPSTRCGPRCAAPGRAAPSGACSCRRRWGRRWPSSRRPGSRPTRDAPPDGGRSSPSGRPGEGRRRHSAHQAQSHSTCRQRRAPPRCGPGALMASRAGAGRDGFVHGRTLILL